ncbi:MAG: hypothetical protein LVT47_05030 [Cyanobacteria bacterium LVE1205-1]
MVKLIQAMALFNQIANLNPWLTDKSCTPSPPTSLPGGEGSRSTPPVPSPDGRGLG